MFFIEQPSNWFKQPCSSRKEADDALEKIYQESLKAGIYDKVSKECYPKGHPFEGHICTVSQFYGLHRWDYKLREE